MTDRRVTRALVTSMLGAVALGAFGACARPGVPPGGPERHTPPMITRIRPDTNTLNVRGDEMVVDFDEVISERPGGSASALGDLVLVSPRDGAPVVDWHRSSLTIRPRHGWRKNTAYTVTILPGISDLRGNVRANTVTVTFSTGPTIPNTVLTGTLFDWLQGTPVITGIVEARPVTDTSVIYIAATDSVGHYRLHGLPAAQYFVRGFVDGNANRGLDPNEAFDSTRVNLADSLSLELLAFAHDSVGPKLSAVTVQDSVTLRANFGTPIDPRTPLAATQFVVIGPDSSRIAVTRAIPASADTVSRTTSPLAAKVQPQSGGAAGGSIVPVPVPQSQRRGQVALPKPSLPLLFRDVVITVARPLRAGATYQLRATDVRGPTGRTASSSLPFTVPNIAPADTARVKKPQAPSREHKLPTPPQPGHPAR